jgi:hypothetical protein
MVASRGQLAAARAHHRQSTLGESGRRLLQCQSVRFSGKWYTFAKAPVPGRRATTVLSEQIMTKRALYQSAPLAPDGH